MLWVCECVSVGVCGCVLLTDLNGTIYDLFVICK
jgi:hypothetical protein